MQTASTPWNQPSFPLACSAAMNSSRPRLPLSSIPSKTRRRFTGSSIPKFLWASRTLSHPKTGPLSSDDPRPMSRPLSAMVKVNGLVSHPSLSRAWIQRFGSVKRDPFHNHGTRGLDVEVAINEDRLLLWILADLSQDCGRKPDFVAIEGLGTEIFYSSLNTEGLELIFHELCHPNNILAVGTVARYTKHIRYLSILREIRSCRNQRSPRNGDGICQSLDEAICIFVYVSQERSWCWHRLLWLETGRDRLL